MMFNTDVAGTWFPSGYYGHFRSKTRNDILQEYRHEATPLPPNQFIKWVRTSPDTHRFSKHDNKHSFPTDASYFDAGMGRRKANASFTAFKPDFMAWLPHREAIAREGSAVSLYRLDFRKGGVSSSEPLPQRLSPRIRKKMAEMEATDAKLKWISDYKKHFSHGQPDVRISTDITTGKSSDGKNNTRSHQYVNLTGKLAKVVPPYLAHARRRIKSAPPVRYSVGDCLVWNPAPYSTPTFKRVSNAGEKLNLSEVTPHPPTERRPAETLQSPKAPTYHSPRQSFKENKNMTPAATEISAFAPVPSSQPYISEKTIISPPQTIVTNA